MILRNIFLGNKIVQLVLEKIKLSSYTIHYVTERSGFV